MTAGTTHLRKVREAYDRASPVWRRIVDPLIYRALARPLIAAVSDAMARPGPILDVAAGTGAFGRTFEHVVAVDISAGQLDGNPATSRIRADAARLPFPADSFVAAGCAFGINHFVCPLDAIREMARVAPVVAVSTWVRPEAAGFAPRRILEAALERCVGRRRSALGRQLDQIGERVGSVAAVTDLLARAGLEPCVREVEVEVPWSSAEAFMEYRLAVPTTPTLVDSNGLRAEVAAAISQLSPAELTWTPLVVIGVGRRG